MVEAFDLGYLYDGIDPAASGYLYDGTNVNASVPDTMLWHDRITVQLREQYQTPYGVDYRDKGDPAYCLCSVEPRTRKQAVFSDNWAQDTSPQSQGGLTEIFTLTIAAPEWHGDINTLVWWKGDCYEVDGSPSYLEHGSKYVKHWEVQARRVLNKDFSPVLVPEPKVPEGSRPWGT